MSKENLPFYRLHPLHILLLPLFFVIHGYNEDCGLIEYSIPAVYLGYYLTLAALLFCAGNVVYGDFKKSGCWATFLLLIFLLFSATPNFLKILHFPGFFISYRFLRPVTGIFFIAGTFLLGRRPNSYTNASKYLTLLFTVLVFIELSSLGFKSTGKNKNSLARFNKPVLSQLPVTDAEKPDIFFIVSGEYASSLRLKKYLQYSNSGTDSLLRENNFYIVPNSKRNYNAAPLSTGAAFNLNYFNTPLAGKETLTKLRLHSFAVVGKTAVSHFLSMQGYRIFNYGLIDIDNHPVWTSEFTSKIKMDVFSAETMWRIRRDTWWNFRRENDTVSAASENAFIARNTENFQFPLQELNFQTATSKFVIRHIMMPHEPFLIDSLGLRINIRRLKNSESSNRQLYISKLAYTNTWIKKLVLAANRKFETTRVVI